MFDTRKILLALALSGLSACGAAPPSELAGSEASPLIGTNALDPTFGNGGLLIVPGSSEFASTSMNDLAIQADGKIVIGTDTTDPVLGSEFAVVRLLPNGAVDSAFGAAGVAKTPYPGPLQSGATSSVAIQSDGKILATSWMSFLTSGPASTLFSVARFNANGSVDTAFGTGGAAVATLPGLSFATPQVIVVQPNGRILVAGSWRATNRSGPTGALVRFNANGTLDTTFGSAGIVASSTFGEITAIALEPDGSILACSHGAVARFSPTGVSESVALLGTLSSIKAKGVTTFTPAGQVVGAVAVQGLGREGRIAQVIEQTLTGAVVFNGPTFNWGSPGVFNAENTAAAIALGPGGKLAVGGAARVCPSSQSTCLVAQTTRMFGAAAVLLNGTPPGSLDPSFGAGGLVQTQFAPNPGANDSFVTSMAVQPADGKVVVLGLASGSLAVARYKAP